MEINVKEVERAIVDGAVDQFVDDGEIYKRIRDGINERIDKLFSERVEPEIHSLITKTMEEGFDRPFQSVDAFGKPQGDKTTIRKELASLTHDYWNTRVDKQGKKTDSTYHSTTRAQWVLVHALGDDFAKEFKQQSVNVACEIKDQLRTNLRGWMDATLGEIFNVQSNQDKKEHRRK